MILLLAGAGYLIYEKWGKHANISKWSFVPADAAMVLELELLEDYYQFSEYPIWRVLQKTKGLKGIEQSILFLDSINGKGGLKSVFDKVPVLISTHKVAANDLDFLYIADNRKTSK